MKQHLLLKVILRPMIHVLRKLVYKKLKHLYKNKL